MSQVRSVEVALGTRSYPIRIGAGLLRDGASLAACAPGRHVLILSDHNVAEHYLAPVQAAFADKSCRVLILPPGEREKNLERFAELMHALATLKASRDATIVALGGGVVGDLAGFAAACWMRGIRFVQLPTTLLAMVDSSVGGKTAVDLPEGKNLVGAFHQPASVLIDTDALHTLPERELRAGFAEVIKYGAIFDAAFFAWLEQHVGALLARSPEHLAHAIEQSCRHKAAVVARDETEQGDRALLNFGHTFGHAIETLGGYALLLHGEAVAIGMLCAARLSQRLGLAPAADSARLERLLQAFGLPTVTPAQLDRAALLDAMRLDKKNRSGTLRLILWRGIGQAFMQDSVDESATEAAFDAHAND